MSAANLPPAPSSSATSISPATSTPSAPPSATPSEETPWWVYMVRCHDGSLYTGATIDPVARARKHHRGKGARYTRWRGVSAIAFCAWMPNKRAALSAEAFIKRWSAVEKRRLAAEYDPIPIADLSAAPSSPPGAV